MEWKHINLTVLVKYDKNTFDLDLDPMTLILKLDLDMVKMYLYTEDEVPSYTSSKAVRISDVIVMQGSSVLSLFLTYTNPCQKF